MKSLSAWEYMSCCTLLGVVASVSNVLLIWSYHNNGHRTLSLSCAVAYAIPSVLFGPVLYSSVLAIHGWNRRMSLSLVGCLKPVVGLLCMVLSFAGLAPVLFFFAKTYDRHRRHRQQSTYVRLQRSQSQDAYELVDFKSANHNDDDHKHEHSGYHPETDSTSAVLQSAAIWMPEVMKSAAPKTETAAAKQSLLGANTGDSDSPPQPARDSHSDDYNNTAEHMDAIVTGANTRSLDSEELAAIRTVPSQFEMAAFNSLNAFLEDVWWRCPLFVKRLYFENVEFVLLHGCALHWFGVKPTALVMAAFGSSLASLITARFPLAGYGLHWRTFAFNATAVSLDLFGALVLFPALVAIYCKQSSEYSAYRAVVQAYITSVIPCAIFIWAEIAIKIGKVSLRVMFSGDSVCFCVMPVFILLFVAIPVFVGIPMLIFALAVVNGCCVAGLFWKYYRYPRFGRFGSKDESSAVVPEEYEANEAHWMFWWSIMKLALSGDGNYEVKKMAAINYALYRTAVVGDAENEADETARAYLSANADTFFSEIQSLNELKAGICGDSDNGCAHLCSFWLGHTSTRWRQLLSQTFSLDDTLQLLWHTFGTAVLMPLMAVSKLCFVCYLTFVAFCDVTTVVTRFQRIMALIYLLWFTVLCLAAIPFARLQNHLSHICPQFPRRLPPKADAFHFGQRTKVAQCVANYSQWVYDAPVSVAIIKDVFGRDVGQIISQFFVAFDEFEIAD